MNYFPLIVLAVCPPEMIGWLALVALGGHIAWYVFSRRFMLLLKKIEFYLPNGGLFLIRILQAHGIDWAFFRDDFPVRPISWCLGSIPTSWRATDYFKRVETRVFVSRRLLVRVYLFRRYGLCFGWP